MYSGIFVLASPGSGKTWFLKQFCDPFGCWDTDWLMNTAVDQKEIFRNLIQSNLQKPVVIMTNRVSWVKENLQLIESCYPAQCRFAISHTSVPKSREYLHEYYQLYWEFQQHLANRGWNCHELLETQHLADILGDYPITETGLMCI